MDTAYLTVKNNLPEASIHLLMQSEECYRCPMNDYGEILPSENHTFQIDTRWYNNYSIVRNLTDSSSLVCQRIFNFRENVDYMLFVTSNDSWSFTKTDSVSRNCQLVYMNKEGDSNIPLYVAVSVLLFFTLLGVLYSLLKKTNIYKRFMNIDQAICNDLGDANATALGPATMADSVSNSNVHLISVVQPSRRRERLKSLDAFRGLSLTLMIFVNYGGGGYWFFNHSLWNGITVADLVFPWFIFVMGTAIAIVFKNVHCRPMPKNYFLYRVLKRSITLFALGLFLNSASIQGDLSKLRIPGVLQRFAITYLVTASLEIVCSRPLRNPRSSIFADQLYLLPHWLVNLCFVILWCSLTFGYYVPNCGRGYIGPGGIQDDGKWRNCSGGTAGYIDEWVFGEHRYHYPTFRKMYKTDAYYDPEGILGSLTSIFICFLGVMAGKILILMPSWKAISIRMLAWSAIFGVITLILTKGTQNEGFIPINKNLWSLSYVLATGSMAFALLLFFYILIDITHVWSGEPLIYPGMNSILIYVCHEVFEHYFPISWIVPETHASQIAMDIWGTCFWVIVSFVLYYKKTFFSI